MEFRDFMSSRKNKKKTPPAVEMCEEKKELSPIDVVGEIRQEQEITTKIKSSGLKFLGEVAILPPASEFEETTLVRVGQKVYIKQNDLWEVLIEGNTRTETIKYTTPVGGGCGVEEVKRIVKETAQPLSFTTYSDLLAAVAANGGQSLGPSASVAGMLWAWDGNAYSPLSNKGGGSYDVIVFGATPGGVMAAVRASMCGASVALVEPGAKIGGMVAGGIQYTDIAPGYSTGMITGLADDFYASVCGYYQGNKSQLKSMRNAQYHSELWYAESLLWKLIKTQQISVYTGAELQSVVKSGTVINSIVTAVGTFSGRAFVDATYELDLLAMAGCTVSIGREATSLYSESGAGVTASSTVTGVDPYIIPGNSDSGLIWGLDAVAPPAVGSADPRCQGITFRTPLSKAGSLPITQPSDYDPTKYELLGRLAAASGSGWTSMTDMVVLYQGRGSQWDLNNKAIAMSTNWYGDETVEWLTATYARRRAIAASIASYIKGLLWFMQTDSRIPAAARENVATYKWASNEFADSGHFPWQVYIREGRRLVGDYVLTMANIATDNNYPDPIAFAYYPPDSHFCRRYASGGAVKLEGLVAGVQPPVSKIPMRVLFPKAVEITNAVATFGVSCSRAAFMSLRVEPTHMSIGDFAGAVAAFAAKRGINVQSTSYSTILPMTGIGRYMPQRPGDVLLFADNSRTTDGTVTKTGTWAMDASPYLTCPGKIAASSTTGDTARFSPTVNCLGEYDIFVRFPIRPTNPFSAAVPVTVSHADGTTSFTMNMSGSDSGNSGNFEHIGTFRFAAGAPSAHYVQIGTDGSGGISAISAVLFRRR